jgi:hypothetical protein
MNNTVIIDALNEEIARLEKVRALLTGRLEPTKPTGKGKRTISAEGRARIAEGQRKRRAKEKSKY